jgi:putative ABC transport system permease protein
MFAGMGKAFTATIDRARADIMILPPRSESLMNGGNGMPARIRPLIYMNPAVVDVQDLQGSGGLFQNDPGPNLKRKREFVQTLGIDLTPGALTLPTDYSPEIIAALQEPYAIAVDETALGRLGVKPGDKASLNGKTIKIGAILHGYPNMMTPTLVGSRQTLRLLGMQPRADRSGPLMVRIADPAKVDLVRDQLNQISRGQYRAWTRAELAKANEASMFKEQIIGVMLGFSVFLGLLIGVGITSQTLRGAILSSIKEFASLRALGVSMGSLRMIVLELSFWVGVVGLGATAVLTYGVYLLASKGGLPMAFPMSWVVGVAILLLVIAVASGLLALGILKKSQPADLLR